MVRIRLLLAAWTNPPPETLRCPYRLRTLRVTLLIHLPGATFNLVVPPLTPRLRLLELARQNILNFTSPPQCVTILYVTAEHVPLTRSPLSGQQTGAATQNAPPLPVMNERVLSNLKPPVNACNPLHYLIIKAKGPGVKPEIRGNSPLMFVFLDLRIKKLKVNHSLWFS